MTFCAQPEWAALETLAFVGNPLGDEGLAALVAPPPPAGAPPTTTGGLTKLKKLDLNNTQVSDAGCATLASALDKLPALKRLYLELTPASAVAKATVGQVRLDERGGIFYVPARRNTSPLPWCTVS